MYLVHTFICKNVRVYCKESTFHFIARSHLSSFLHTLGIVIILPHLILQFGYSLDFAVQIIIELLKKNKVDLILFTKNSIFVGTKYRNCDLNYNH